MRRAFSSKYRISFDSLYNLTSFRVNVISVCVILQPKWNNGLLGVFRIDYVGSAPYINCIPSLYHHRLGLRDRFLILSSDGLYQYFTNEEAVSEVETFMSIFPEGDPAQHLVEEVLFRAAKKAGKYISQLVRILNTTISHRN